MMLHTIKWVVVFTTIIGNPSRPVAGAPEFTSLPACQAYVAMLNGPVRSTFFYECYPKLW